MESATTNKDTVEMHRLGSYELNLNKEEGKIQENEDILSKSDFLVVEQNTPSHFQHQKKGFFSISKRMRSFCLVLFLLVFFMSINVSLLVVSKARSSEAPLDIDITPNTTINSTNITKDIITNENNNKTDDSSNHTIKDNTIKNNENSTVYPRRLFFILNQSSLLANEENKPMGFFETLNISIYFENNDEFNIKISPIRSNQFTIPETYPFPFTKNISDPNQEFIQPNYLIDIANHSKFSIKIRRKATNELIFDSSHITFIFTARLIEFGTKLPTDYLFGLGERKAEFLYKSGVYTIWNRNSDSELDNGTPGHQSSGTHPMYLSREKSGFFNVMLLKNVNGMQFAFKDDNELKFKLVGGIIDLKFFLGDREPETAIRKYHLFINRFAMVPFWAFGLHYAVIGDFTNQPNKMIDILDQFKENRLPIDSIWSDSEIMQKCNRTINSSMLDVIAEVRKKVKFIIQISLGVTINPDDEFFQSIYKDDAIVKSSKTKKPLIACQCGDKILFPDFNHPNITNYWSNLLHNYHDRLKFDGVSISMNEPTLSKDFSGELKNLEENCPTNNNSFPKPDLFENYSGWVDSSLDQIDLTQLPFLPEQNLDKETLAIDSYHYNESEYFNFTEIRELDFHNMNGFFSAYLTSKILKNNLNLENPFISTTSSIFGTGNFATHWLGESLFSWTFLKASIASLFNANLFNMPVSGMDVCSFSDTPNAELCARWIQLGVLYPLMRFRISDKLVDSGVFSFNESFVMETARKSLDLRYSLLKYYFSLFEKKNGTGMVFQPLFFEFPDEEIVYMIETQFMLGKDVMVTPVLEPKLQMVSVYFPRNLMWVEYNSKQIFINKQSFKQDVEAKLNETCPIFVREGSMVFSQKTDIINNTYELDNNFKIFAVMKNITKDDYIAEGEILALNDYNDEKKLESCRKGLDGNLCFIKVFVKATIMGPPEYLTKITIEFIAKENSDIGEVYIEELELHGMQIKNKFSIKSVILDPKVKIEKNLTKTFVNS